MPAIPVSRMLVLLLALMPFILKAQQVVRFVALEVAVVDGTGLPVPGKVTVIASDESVVYSGDSLQTVVLNVHPGPYRVAFESKFFDSATRNIDAVQSDNLAVLTTRLGRFALEASLEPVAVSVRATPAVACRAGGLLWAKLIALFGEYSSERLLKPAGDSAVALFEPVEFGTYILAVVEGDRVRGLKEIQTSRSLTTVSIAIEPCTEK